MCVETLLSDSDSLHDLLVCKSRIRRCHDLGLGDLISKALDEHLSPETLPAIFERRFYSLWLTRAWQDAPALRNFRGAAHAEVIERFKKLDEHHEKLAQRRLQTQLFARRREVWQTEDQELLHILNELKRLTSLKRQRPIRRIIQQTSKALIQLKPCWMMSPLSISQFIDGDMQAFDLVIFDEASQVSPEDAICAIARGKRLIVVGDDKQLPPTRFFAKSLSDEEDDEDEAQEQPARVDSILKECDALPQKSLLWHYRSKDETLIYFSNEKFYGGRLITFPSITSSNEMGVRFEYVQDGVYDRGGRRTNQREAERVVDLIVAHVRRQDGRELGVVALSQAQEAAIGESLQRRCKADPTLSAFDLIGLSPAASRRDFNPCGEAVGGVRHASCVHCRVLPVVREEVGRTFCTAPSTSSYGVPWNVVPTGKSRNPSWTRCAPLERRSLSSPRHAAMESTSSGFGQNLRALT